MSITIQTTAEPENRSTSMLLNADVGEGMASDAQIIPYLHQANIACGLHAGDLATMQKTVASCLEHKVMIGAHPSYDDRANFGRVSHKLSTSETIQLVHKQLDVLNAVCMQQGANIAYLKPHGALYNDMMSNETVYQAILQAVANHPLALKLMISAMPNSNAAKYEVRAREAGVSLYYEAFADRLYLDNGLLCPRSQSGAVFTDSGHVLQQAHRLITQSTVATISGEELLLNANTLCLHGDNPTVVDVIVEIHSYLANHSSEA